MKEEDLTRKRICELAERAYNNNYYTYTDFLGLAEVNILQQLQLKDDRLRGIDVTMSGGCNGCERVMAAFGNSEEFGYECSFPIVCLKIVPTAPKYADTLTHRDYLGAVMNLGIERSLVGDIVISNNEGFMFCTEGIAEYIINNFNKVRHTEVNCTITTELPDINSEAVMVQVQVSSERIDAVTAKLYKLSRNNAVKLFQERKIYVCGRLCENSSYTPKNEDVISVRGFGRYRYCGIERETGKGKLIVNVLKW